MTTGQCESPEPIKLTLDCIEWDMTTSCSMNCYRDFRCEVLLDDGFGGSLEDKIHWAQPIIPFILEAAKLNWGHRTVEVEIFSFHEESVITTEDGFVLDSRPYHDPEVLIKGRIYYYD